MDQDRIDAARAHDELDAVLRRRLDEIARESAPERLLTLARRLQEMLRNGRAGPSDRSRGPTGP